MFFVGWLFFLVGGRDVVAGSEACSSVAAASGRLRRPSCDEVNVLPQIRVISGVIPGCRENGEPGIHNHGARVMDSGLTIFGGAPGMTEPGFADAQHK